MKKTVWFLSLVILFGSSSLQAKEYDCDEINRAGMRYDYEKKTMISEVYPSPGISINISPDLKKLKMDLAVHPDVIKLTGKKYSTHWFTCRMPYLDSKRYPDTHEVLSCFGEDAGEHFDFNMKNKKYLASLNGGYLSGIIPPQITLIFATYGTCEEKIKLKSNETEKTIPPHISILPQLGR